MEKLRPFELHLYSVQEGITTKGAGMGYFRPCMCSKTYPISQKYPIPSPLVTHYSPPYTDVHAGKTAKAGLLKKVG